MELWRRGGRYDVSNELHLKQFAVTLSLLCFALKVTVLSFIYSKESWRFRERGGIVCGCCGLEVSSWSVWLAVGKRECRGALDGWKEKEEGFLGRQLLFFVPRGWAADSCVKRESFRVFCGLRFFVVLSNCAKPPVNFLPPSPYD